MHSVQVGGGVIRLATAADREAIRRLVNQAFEVERFLKKGGGDRLQQDGEFERLWGRGAFLVKEEDGALVGCVYVEPRSERIFASSRHSGDSRSVASLNGKATTSSPVLREPKAKTFDRAYLGLLSIAPSRQGAGLGKQLNAAAEQYARGQGCRWMDLRVVSPRADLLVPLYRRLGYAETGTEEYPAELVEKMTIPGHFILMAKAL
ncbi:MAG TPA: GNAT family N-acetyltransferase [Acidobacteriaceae bacterium]|jgi:predicted N-acetyltransferase YhbS